MKDRVRRIAGALIAVWLVMVLMDYFDVLELDGVLGDLALATLLIVIASMIWKYLLRLMLRGAGAE